MNQRQPVQGNEKDQESREVGEDIESCALMIFQKRSKERRFNEGLNFFFPQKLNGSALRGQNFQCEDALLCIILSPEWPARAGDPQPGATKLTRFPTFSPFRETRPFCSPDARQNVKWSSTRFP